jgi:hypothetical protein
MIEVAFAAIRVSWISTQHSQLQRSCLFAAGKGLKVCMCDGRGDGGEGLTILGILEQQLCNAGLRQYRRQQHDQWDERHHFTQIHSGSMFVTMLGRDQRTEARFGTIDPNGTPIRAGEWLRYSVGFSVSY